MVLGLLSFSQIVGATAIAFIAFAAVKLYHAVETFSQDDSHGNASQSDSGWLTGQELRATASEIIAAAVSRLQNSNRYLAAPNQHQRGSIYYDAHDLLDDPPNNDHGRRGTIYYDALDYIQHSRTGVTYSEIINYFRSGHWRKTLFNLQVSTQKLAVKCCDAVENFFKTIAHKLERNLFLSKNKQNVKSKRGKTVNKHLKKASKTARNKKNTKKYERKTKKQTTTTSAGRAKKKQEDKIQKRSPRTKQVKEVSSKPRRRRPTKADELLWFPQAFTSTTEQRISDSDDEKYHRVVDFGPYMPQWLGRFLKTPTGRYFFGADGKHISSRSHSGRSSRRSSAKDGRTGCSRSSSRSSERSGRCGSSERMECSRRCSDSSDDSDGSPRRFCHCRKSKRRQ